MQLTLKDFIIRQLTEYNLPVTDKNLKKLRRKFTSILKAEPFKSKQTWEKAETITNGKNKTKLFSFKDLQQVAKIAAPYMKKQCINNATMPKKELQRAIKKNTAALIEQDKAFQESQKKFEKEIQNPNSKFWKTNTNFEEPVIPPDFDQNEETLKEDINQIMLEAIFQKFFKPAPHWKKQFVDDYNITHDPASDDYINDPRYIDADYRLSHPKGPKSYYQDR